MRASSSPPSDRGMTLLEVLIASTVLAIFIGMVARTVVIAYRNQGVTSRKTETFRRAVDSLEWVGREIRLCERVYSPKLSVLTTGVPYLPGLGNAPAFVFRHYDATTGSEIVVGYTYDSSTSRVLRSVYQPDFNPANPSTEVPVSTRTLADKAESLEITWIDPGTTYGVQLLRLRIPLQNVTPTPVMEVRVKKL